MKPKALPCNELIDIHKNRLDFHMTAQQKIAHAKLHNKIVGLLLIDLDNFRSINNQHGHAIGDKILYQTQERLASCLNPDDFITRIDGDEFVVILADTSNNERTEKTIHQLMNCFKMMFTFNGIDARISASMGIAYYPYGGRDVQTLLQNAAISMDYAKTLGGNNYQYHSKKICKKYKTKFYLENALKFAVERNELFLNYQPIFNLFTNKVIGMEALLRWRHPVNGLISPNIFIDLAEKNGLISSIGEWALKTVCGQAREWHNAGYNQLKISFNISSHQLLQKSFPKLLLRMFKDTAIPTHLLDLELTETAFITHSNYFEVILKKSLRQGLASQLMTSALGILL